MQLADADPCRDHPAGRGQENLTASGEGRSATSGAGSKLRVIANLSPCLLRGMSMSPRHSLSFQKTMFLVLTDRCSSQEGQLLWDLLCVAEDERQSCLDRQMITTFDDLPDRLGL